MHDLRRLHGHRAWRRVALAGAAVTYLLVVLGGIVRITGSGMGCGDDWPLCNGELIPPMDLPTLIEYGHRLVAAGVAVLVATLSVQAWRRRSRPRWAPMRRVAAWAAVLLIVQVMLGAVTVWLELPPSSVVLHLGTGMALLGVLLVACAQGYDPERTAVRKLDGPARLAISAATLGLVVVLVGALVANLGAAPACQGFPLCNDALLPAGHWRIHVHWWHRALAYLLVAAAFGLPFLAARRRPHDQAARATAWAVVGLGVAQVAVAAAMMFTALDDAWRALHVAVGAGLFGTLVLHAWVVSHPEPELRG